MLKVKKQQPTFHLYLKEVRFRVSEKRSVVGFHMHPTHEAWFVRHFLPALRTRRSEKYGTDDTLLSRMTKLCLVTLLVLCRLQSEGLASPRNRGAKIKLWLKHRHATW